MQDKVRVVCSTLAATPRVFEVSTTASPRQFLWKLGPGRAARTRGHASVQRVAPPNTQALGHNNQAAGGGFGRVGRVVAFAHAYCCLSLSTTALAACGRLCYSSLATTAHGTMKAGGAGSSSRYSSPFATGAVNLLESRQMARRVRRRRRFAAPKGRRYRLGLGLQDSCSSCILYWEGQTRLEPALGNGRQRLDGRPTPAQRHVTSLFYSGTLR